MFFIKCIAKGRAKWHHIKNLISISLCNHTSVSGVLKIIKSMGFFSRTRSLRLSWLGEGSCTVSGWAVFTWEKLTFCSRGKGNNAASQEGGKGRAEHQLVQWKLNSIFVCSTDSLFSVFYPLLQLPLMQTNPSSASFQSTNLLCTSSL